MIHYTIVEHFNVAWHFMDAGTLVGAASYTDKMNWGVFSAIPGLPEGIEDPEFDTARMQTEVVLIDADELLTTDELGNKILNLGNKRMQWDNTTWNIEYAEKPDDGREGELMFWVSRKDINHEN